jgi:hypothetical protein
MAEASPGTGVPRNTRGVVRGQVVEAMVADYGAGGRVGELAKVYGIHRTTVSAHVARAGIPAAS